MAKHRSRWKAPPAISRRSCGMPSKRCRTGGLPWSVGGRFTTADMLLTTCLTWAVSYRVRVTAPCLAYMERITSRPAYHASVAANTPKAA